MDMDDQDIAKLASKLTESLTTKDDLKQLEGRLGVKIDLVNEKVDGILKFAEAIPKLHLQLLTKLKVNPN